MSIVNGDRVRFRETHRPPGHRAGSVGTVIEARLGYLVVTFDDDGTYQCARFAFEPVPPGLDPATRADDPRVEPTVTRRAAVLREAERITAVDRNSTYGEPEDNLGRIARLWSVYLEREVSARDVAWLMVLLKVAREVHTPHRDNPVDVAGYAALAEEVTPLVD